MKKYNKPKTPWYQQYALTLLVLGIVLLLSLMNFKENDSPTRPRPFSTCSVLHCLVGVLCGLYLPINIMQFTLLHIGFEIIENSTVSFWHHHITKKVVQFLGQIFGNELVVRFVGRDYRGDSAINTNMDTVLAVAGFWAARSNREQMNFWDVLKYQG